MLTVSLSLVNLFTMMINMLVWLDYSQVGVYILSYCSIMVIITDKIFDGDDG